MSRGSRWGADGFVAGASSYTKYPRSKFELLRFFGISTVDRYRTFAICCFTRYHMPQTRVLFFQNTAGFAPVWEWLTNLRKNNPKAYAKCAIRLRRLAEMGHELRRPEADLLRDGIYELRARLGTVNYRLLYFFHGRNVAVLAHAITKEDEIPATEINREIEHKRTFAANPTAHTFIGDIEHA